MNENDSKAMTEDNASLPPVSSKDNGQSVCNNHNQVERPADPELVRVMQTYTFDLARRLERQTLVLTLLIVFNLAVGIFVSWQAYEAGVYAERASKRHWELARVIDLSQRRSEKGSAQSNPDMP